MPRFVYYLPVLVTICLVSYLYFFKFRSRPQSDNSETDIFESKEVPDTTDKGKQSVDDSSNELLTDVIMLISFILITYVIVLPSLLDNPENISLPMNLLVLAAGFIAVCYQGTVVLKKYLKQKKTDI